MFIMKHRNKPKEYWIFVCNCGCEWVTDRETEIRNKYRDSSGVFTSCICPECNNLVNSKRHIGSEEYDKLHKKASSEKEELH